MANNTRKTGNGYQNYTNQSESFISPLSEHGMLRSSDVNGGIWLYALIPHTQSLSTTATDSERVMASDNLLGLFEGLAGMVPASVAKFRDFLRSQYREFHVLTTNVPAGYHPPLSMRGTQLYDWLNQRFTGRINTGRKVAVVGVRLLPAHKTDQKRGPLERFVYWLDDWAFSLQNGIESFNNYLYDMRIVERLMLSAGLRPMSVMSEPERNELIHLMKTWWMPSADKESLPILVENDHLHFFKDIDSCVTAKKKHDSGVDCERWNIGGQFPATPFFVKSATFQEAPITDLGNLWAARLMTSYKAGGGDALGISIRGLVEPSKITQKEILRNKNSVKDAVKDRAKHNREATNDQEEVSAELAYKQRLYNQKNVPPTLIDVSVCAAVEGLPERAKESLMGIGDMEFASRNTGKEQLMAFKTMQACSPVRMRPYDLHWSSTMVSGAGLASFADAGDKAGAFLGLTEADRQPVYCSPTLVEDEDMAPIFVVLGQTGSGKTMLMMNLALQWSMMVPVVYFDPKQNSDLSEGVKAVGGRTYSMDTDLSQGVFDPLAVMDSPQSALNMATHMLTSILYEGTPDQTDREGVLRNLIAWGIRHGYRTTGLAVVKAAEAMEKGDESLRGLDEDMVRSVASYLVTSAGNDPVFSIICSMSEHPDRLSRMDGLTYFRAGSLQLNPPSGGGRGTITSRMQQWLLRMAVFGMGQAVMGRDGMVILDEAWMALGGDSGSVVDEWGRVARSQRFTPVLGSQKVDEFIDAGLAGAISRVLVLAMDDTQTEGELSPSRKALRLAGIRDETGYLTYRLPLPRDKGSKEHPSPNWQSMRDLREDGRSVRGSVCVFSDAHKSPVLVENIIDPEVLAAISTTAKDVDERNARRKEADNG